MKKGTLKQMLVITDGGSNTGEDPVAMAALAKEQGISVNVIGVMEEDTIDEQSTNEIEGIAMSGGGVSQIVYVKQLSQTVQMVTRQAMTQTLQGVVNKELQQILGSSNSRLEELSPEKRGEIMEVVDELGETVDLEILILVDMSGSMKNKLPTVKESLLDLSLSLNARMGHNQFSIFFISWEKERCREANGLESKIRVAFNDFPKTNSRRYYAYWTGYQRGYSLFHQKALIERVVKK